MNYGDEKTLRSTVLHPAEVDCFCQIGTPSPTSSPVAGCRCTYEENVTTMTFSTWGAVLGSGDVPGHSQTLRQRP